MPFVYHGKDERIAKEVAEAQETLNRRYAEILGPERTEKLRRVVQRTLGPQSFFDTAEEVNRYLKLKIPESTCSKLLFAADATGKVHENGRIQDSSVKVGAAIYVSEDSFNHSGSRHYTNNPIATYVHEFDHFVWAALQKVPFYLALPYMTQGRVSTNKDDLDKFITEIEKSELTLEQKRNRLALNVGALVTRGIFEDANQVLDKMVLESIGIDVPLPWRGKERQYMVGTLPQFDMMLAIPTGGDPFFGLDDVEVIDRFIQWEKTAAPVIETPYLDNFFDSLREIEVEMLPIWEIRRRTDEHTAKKELRKEARSKKKTFKKRSKKSR
jgi:hypothetical protein